MTRKMNKGDAILDPDSPEDDRFFSDEWLSDNGALIDITIDAESWQISLIDDLKTRGPVMLDHIVARLSLDPQIVSLLLCDDEGMRAMNRMYRGFDKPTNVLSFPACNDLQWAGHMPSNKLSIGDIAIAGETVVREASEASIVVGDHLLHLFTHGILHLLGYNHEEDSTACEMEWLEIHLLQQMGVANPYHGDDLIFGTREIG